MANPKVFFVHLRRPNKRNPRDDPFYEFGSFGCTGCHKDNLLHPRHAEELEGARLAFIQGGEHGSRLVLLTPPITEVKKWKNNCEAKWPAVKFLRYKEAPILVWNNGPSDVKSVKKFASGTRWGKEKVESGLSSKVRSRARPLEPELANEVIAVYERMREAAPRSAFVSRKIDRDRKATYERYTSELAGDTDGAEMVLHAEGPPPKAQVQSRCGRSRRRRSRPRTRRCK
jgi:hypothetical protein